MCSVSLDWSCYRSKKANASDIEASNVYVRIIFIVVGLIYEYKWTAVNEELNKVVGVKWYRAKMRLKFYIRLYFIAAPMYHILLYNEWITHYKTRKIGSNGHRHYGPISSLIRVFNFYSNSITTLLLQWQMRWNYNIYVIVFSQLIMATQKLPHKIFRSIFDSFFEMFWHNVRCLSPSFNDFL